MLDFIMDENMVAFIKATVDDDHGISEEAMELLCKIAKDDSRIRDLLSQMRGTDGRYYLKEPIR